jgi:lysozyme family protein
VGPALEEGVNFDQAFDALIGHEGGYSNNPVDPGGETMWGVTARVARANGYTGEMRYLARETAKDIYRKLYWDSVHADELPEPVRYPVFDASVNSGVVQAIKWLQRAVDVADDGVIGPITISAANRAGKDAAVRLTADRLDFMTSLPTWGAFGKGWARRVAAILKGI